MFPCSPPPQPSSDVMLLQQPEGLLMLRRAAFQTTSSGGVNLARGWFFSNISFLDKIPIKRVGYQHLFVTLRGITKKVGKKKPEKKKETQKFSLPNPHPPKKIGAPTKFHLGLLSVWLGSPTKKIPQKTFVTLKLLLWQHSPAQPGAKSWPHHP